MRIKYTRSFDARVTQEYEADIYDPTAIADAVAAVREDWGWAGDELDGHVLAESDMESEEVEMAESDPMMTSTVTLLDPQHDITHVMPLNLTDLADHRGSSDCWCEPVGVAAEGRWLYIHRDKSEG